MDMMTTIVPKSDQLNADDLIGQIKTVKITAMAKGSGDQPVKVSYEGDNGKPYLPCLSMRRVMVYAWGKDGKAYVGRSLTLFRDKDVTWAGAKVGGIRISHMSHIDKDLTVSLTASSKSKKPYTVKPLVIKEAPPIDPKIKEAGDKSAKEGVDKYIAWRDTLSAEQKESIKPFNPAWSATAKEADKANGEIIDI